MRTMTSRDIVNGALAKVFITLNENRYELANIKNLKATVTFNKQEENIMGTTATINIATTWKGACEGEMFYNSSILAKMAEEFQNTGNLPYFEIMTVNEDPSKSVGRNSTILENCLLDEVVIAAIDVDNATLKQDFKCTFEKFKLPETFKDLPLA
jgi:hypothetical protein